MKRIISVLLTVLLLVSLGSAALAADDSSVKFDEVGLEVSFPAEFSELHGVLLPEPYGKISYGPDIYYMPIFYFAMDRAVFDEITEKDVEDVTEEEIEAIRAAQTSLCNVLVCEDGIDAAMELLGVEEIPEDQVLLELGTLDNLTYFILMEKGGVEAYELDGVFADEYTTLQTSALEAFKNARFYEPVVPGADLIGSTVSFETADLDGNPVSSGDLFAGNKVTMINYWGTWCGACVGELEELGQIHARLQEKGCGIIGILEDGDDPEKVALAKSILAENGVTYLNLVPDDSMTFLDEVQSYPTSFLVDSNGTIVGEPFSGAMVDAYEPAIDKLLSGEDLSGMTMPGASANDAEAYRIMVVDNEGNPVKGVAVRFCDDTSCSLAKTDADGVASFSMPDGVSYIVHVLKVPEGYEKNSGEYHTLDVYSDLVIVLDSAA